MSRVVCAGGVTGGIVGGLLDASPPPPPPPPPPPAPVRVGGNIKQPTKIKDVRPVYPPIAQSARVQGVVIIEATIGPNGRVQDARRCFARSRCSTRRRSTR
ncbi:MAG: energy transducer TonB [Vicinamibacterales bacterium]